MSKLLQKAFASVAALPEPDQEKIGRELLEHVDKLKFLRAQIEEGMRSLDRGQGRELDMEDVIRRARSGNAGP